MVRILWSTSREDDLLVLVFLYFSFRAVAARASTGVGGAARARTLFVRRPYALLTDDDRARPLRRGRPAHLPCMARKTPGTPRLLFPTTPITHRVSSVVDGSRRETTARGEGVRRALPRHSLSIVLAPDRRRRRGPVVPVGIHTVFVSRRLCVIWITLCCPLPM